MKGSILDIAFVVVFFFAVSIMVIFMFMFLSNVNDRLQTIDSVSNFTKTTMQGSIDQWLWFDQVLILLIGGLMLVVIIGASQINAHPIFFIGSLIFLIVLGLMSAQFTNFFMAFAGQETIATYSNQFPYTVIFFQNLPLIVIAYAVLLVVVMYTFGGRSDYGV